MAMAGKRFAQTAEGGENAIDIMRRCHSEDKYQEIFDAYSN